MGRSARLTGGVSFGDAPERGTAVGSGQERLWTACMRHELHAASLVNVSPLPKPLPVSLVSSAAAAAVVHGKSKADSESAVLAMLWFMNEVSQ
jgi:hypothetical protein